MLHLGTPFSIPEVVDEHLEVLPLLLALREQFLCAGHVTARALRDHDERIDAHADGLVLAGADAREAIEAMLMGADPGAAAAAALVCARAGDAGHAKLVLDAFATAKGDALFGLGTGLSLAPIASLRAGLAGLAAADASAAAWTAARVLAFHGAETPDALRSLAAMPAPADADAARAALALLAVLGAARLAKLPVRELRAGLETCALAEDAALRRAAIEAAAWTKQPWLLERCRAAAASPGHEALDWLRALAVLGGPEDRDRVLALARATALGAARHALLGAYGHPAVVPVLLEGMRDADAETAAAAGAAFQRVTGCDAESGVRARVVPPGEEPDEFEREFLEEVALPDPDKAAALWDERRKTFEAGKRWCAGVEVESGGIAAADALALGLRREAYLRAASRGAWPDGVGPLEKFTFGN